MSESFVSPANLAPRRILSLAASAAFVFLVIAGFAPTPSSFAQQPPAPPSADEKPLPGFDPSSIDVSADPCVDMYKFACGKFAANHPIPSDLPGVDPFYVLYNVDTQELNGILTKAQAGGDTRSPDQQKIGDYFKECTDTSAIEAAGLKPIQPLLDEIDSLGTPAPKVKLAALLGELQRNGVDAFFGFGEQQDYKDATKQIAFIQQGGLGMPEKDYYLRIGDKDQKLRDQYVAHVAKMLTLAGSSPEQAQKDAQNIMTLETALAKASLGVVDMREPEKTYHLQPIATFQAALPGVNFDAFADAIHSPQITEINNSTPDFWPEMLKQIRTIDPATMRAYLRYHLLTTVARNLPKAFDDENFDFYGRILEGQPEQRARWKRCSNAVNGALGEALGKVYVDQYFAGDSKAKMLQMVHDIESAMGRDIDQIDWMSAPTKVRAREKLHAVADKIGYPDKWRDYSKLTVTPADALGNQLRANAFENDRQLNKIGKPVDRGEWDMSPPTVNAYYDDSLNDINFPAGILQPPFYDRSQDIAVNYGHIGAVIGHELTHGFDDEGRKFDAKGNLDDWWTPADLKNFTTRTDCLVNEYSGFTAVDDVKVNGKLTLGENTADNGGALLAFMAYLQRAKDDHVDINAKRDGYTGPQRFYIAFAQNWCANERPEAIREQVLQDPHSPDHFRTDGVIVNQPGFAAAFGCKKPSPMVPANSCRVW
jgi:endothelin-converting enzyme/putative endopeptidase